MGEGPRKAKAYLTQDIQQGRVLTLCPLVISISRTLQEPGVVSIFVLFYVFSVFLSFNSVLREF